MVNREWEEARAHIMPVLVSAYQLHKYHSDSVRREWVNGLYIFYVVDMAGDGFETLPITRQQCVLWRISPAKLHEQAIFCLQHFSEQVVLDGGHFSEFTMVETRVPNNYNSSRILLPLYGRLSRHLGQSFFVSIASRHKMMVFGKATESAVERLRAAITLDYIDSGDARLCPHLFVVSLDGTSGDPAMVEEAEAV